MYEIGNISDIYMQCFLVILDCVVLLELSKVLNWMVGRKYFFFKNCSLIFFSVSGEFRKKGIINSKDVLAVGEDRHLLIVRVVFSWHFPSKGSEQVYCSLLLKKAFLLKEEVSIE